MYGTFTVVATIVTRCWICTAHLKLLRYIEGK